MDTDGRWLFASAWSQIGKELEATLNAYPAMRPLVQDSNTTQIGGSEVPVDVVLTTLGLALARAATAPIHALSGLDIKRIEAIVAQLRHFEEDRIGWEHQVLVEHDLQSARELDYQSELQRDLETYERVRLAESSDTGTSSIMKRVSEFASAKQVESYGLAESFKWLGDLTRAQDGYLSNRTADMPDVSWLNNRMGRQWLALPPATQVKIVEDVRTTMIFWKIAQSAIMSPSRPGIAQALTYGLQIPLKDGDEIPPSESGIEKSLKNLRSSWSWLLERDCALAQWVALYLLNLRPSGENRKVVGEAIRAFASADTLWTAPSGRKAKSEFSVLKWRCDTCNLEFHPGDHTHDSPLAVKKRAAGEEVQSIHAKPVGTTTERERNRYRLSHRMLAGLPSTAADWNRLMCAFRDPESRQPCWKRGGVLTPMPPA